MSAPVEALQLLLQNADVCHSVSRANNTVITLMSAANAVQAMVEKHCSGSLCLTFSSEDASDKTWDNRHRKHRENSFGAWLLKHCHLLKSLQLDDDYSVSGDFSDSFLMPALRAAAASPTGLQLASFSSNNTSNNSVAVLQLLPASKVTQLSIRITNAAGEPGDGFDDMQYSLDDDQYELEMMMHESHQIDLRLIRTQYDTSQMAATLASFSRLASLSVGGYETLIAKSPTMGAMPQLTSLTKLSFDSVLTPEGLKKLQLPAQLRELELLHLNRSAAQSTLNWGHLTALTRLHTKGRYEGYNSCGVCVRQGDVLPPNLVTLCIGGCAALASLVSLPSLRQLSIASLAGLELPGAPPEPPSSNLLLMRLLLNTANQPGLAAAAAAAGAGAPAQGHSFSSQLHSQAEQVAAARLEQLQQRLPAVQIRITKGWAPKDFDCFCCSGDSA